MSDDKKASRSKWAVGTIIAGVGAVAALIGALAATGFLKRADPVTPYQQQVHATCNRLQDLSRDVIGQLGPSFSPDGQLFVDKALLLRWFQSNYDAAKLQLELLDQRTTPTALKEEKRREEVAKDAYLAAMRSDIERVQRDLPARLSFQQLSPMEASFAPFIVEMNDALTGLAGGDCTVTRSKAGSRSSP
jgi:hypothetical protein